MLYRLRSYVFTRNRHFTGTSWGVMEVEQAFWEGAHYVNRGRAESYLAGLNDKMGILALPGF